MAFSFKTLISPLLALAASAGAAAVSGKAAAFETLAQTAVKSAVTKVDGGVDKLAAAFTTYAADNEIVSQGIDTFQTLAKSAGLSVPTLDVVRTHIEAAIYDVATIIVPAEQMPQAQTAQTATDAPASAGT